MPERTVKQALTAYVDERGIRRYGIEGETVNVHPDHVKAFDEGQGVVTPTKAAPQKRAATQPKSRK